MSLIWTPSRKILSQPQGAVSLDWGHPAAEGLLAFLTFSPTVWDHVSGQQSIATQLNVDYNTPIESGVGSGVNRTSANGYMANNSGWAGLLNTTSGGFAIGAVPRTPYRGIYLASMRGTTERRFYLSRNSSRIPTYGFMGSANIQSSESLLWPDNEFRVSALEWNSSLHRWIFDGKLAASGGGASGAPTSAALGTLSSLQNETQWRANAVFQFFAIWAQPIGVEAHAEFAANPWRILKKSPNRMIFLPGGDVPMPYTGGYWSTNSVIQTI